MKTKLSTLMLSKLTFSSLKLTFTLLMLAFTTLTLTFTACSNDDEDNILSEDEGKQLAHPAVVDFSAGITTRVTTSSEWEAGDLVGISASEIAGTVSTPKYTNIQYKADIAGASTAFSLVETEQEEIAYTSENDMIFTAYYPYTDNKDGVIEANTATTEEEQKKIDFLFASSKGKYIEGNANQKINFTFQHKMARIRLKIKVTDATPIENKSIILGGLIHKGTFNIKSGIASANGNVENDWSLGNLSSTASGTEMEIVRIIYPQNAESLDLRIGNEDDNLKTSFNLFGNKFEPNNSYTINAEVRNGKIHATITLDNNTIEGWNENEPGKKAFIGIADNTAHGHLLAFIVQHLSHLAHLVPVAVKPPRRDRLDHRLRPADRAEIFLRRTHQRRGASVFLRARHIILLFRGSSSRLPDPASRARFAAFAAILPQKRVFLSPPLAEAGK